MAEQGSPVIILGAGINGVAIARELLLNGLPVVLVDHSDYAAGTTSWSTRLIHGGLRYLEHGETSLVYESLAERERFLENSPEHVTPLELLIPVKSQFAGLISSAAGLFQLPILKSKSPSRGSWAIRSGLTMYDWLAGSQRLGKHRRLSKLERSTIGLENRFIDVFAYFDGQIEFPELYVASMIRQCEEIARSSGVSFQLRTYHRATLDGTNFELQSILPGELSEECVCPIAVVNASGPSGDETLSSLGIASPRLFRGTRGSHLITDKPELLQTLDERGFYAEAFDGRPVFILPFHQSALIGTTDLLHEGDPEEAIASEEEIDYLIRCVNSVLPSVKLTRSDITQHYSGVRPLPFVDRRSTAAIPRGHWLHEHDATPWPCFTVVGGKLTTCRSLAEQAAKQILQRLGRIVLRNSRNERTYNGQPNIQPGERARFIISHLTCVDARSDTKTLATAAIEQLHAKTISDLIERRLMLIFDPKLSRTDLEIVADALIATGKLSEESKSTAIAEYVNRLQSRFGKQVAPS